MRAAAGPSPSAVEPDAFTERAFRRYGPEVRHYLLRRLYRAHDAEDVVQEVFMRLLRVPDKKFIRDPRAYLYGIALHVVREFKSRDEKAGVWPALEPQELAERAERSTETHRDEMPERLSLQRQLERALRRLPAAHRTVFLLHKRDGYSYEEIAVKLKISVHMVDKYLLQAKARLRAGWMQE